LTNNEARAYFVEKGLSYDDVTEENLDLLERLLILSLAEYRTSGDEHAEQMGMYLQKRLKKHTKILKGTGMQYAMFRVKGSYFKNREAITFNRDGFIGFGGEFSSANVQPMLRAFCSWCNEISRVKQNQEVTA
jgi:hypothetical protein